MVMPQVCFWLVLETNNRFPTCTILSKNGSPVVIISSDKPDLNGIPPQPRLWGRIVKFIILIQVVVK
ncbi:hypothetical protein BAU22_13215 [Bacillus sp. 4048]|nr:hypothetical protein A6281_17175 [Bacillus wiedmannii]OAK35655.1 hypothetical protein A6284_27395 [Bacillus wiedmannii]OAK41715.1 hypothetical protein A6285_23105 [Bacillus wiedmannii]OJD46621.1 hypothetical protein BAU22_13215 [Bacillus sp. 4048]